MKMFVSKLEIKNLRSFEYFKINLSKKLNILIGPNNSGKSTIIKSLYKLQESRTLNENDVRTGANKSQVLIEINDVSETEKPLFKNGKAILLPKTSKAHILFESVIDRKYNDSIEQNGYEHLEVNLKSISENSSTGNFAFVNFLGFPNSEDKGNFIYPFLSKRKTSYLNSQGGKEATYTVTANFQNLPAKIQKVTSHPKTRLKFEKLCKDILGFTPGLIPGEEDEDKIGMYSGEEIKNPPIPIESMGEGVINIIGLISLLLTEDGKLFIIEELENDIHPLALKKLMNLIIEKSKNNQFVISTHSHIVLTHLGSAEDSKIFSTEVFYDEEKNLFFSKIKCIENKPYSKMKILEDLGYEFGDYNLHEGWLFFEESSAEELIRDYFIPWFFHNTKMSRFRTFSAKSFSEVEVKFDSFNKLFVYLHLTQVYKNKAWVIIDAGEKEKEILDKIKKKYTKHGWNEENFLQWSKHDFEEYYPPFFKEKVEEIRNSRKDNKPILKANLLNEVKKWINQNSESAKNEFEKSANEVIQFLKKIM